MTAVNVKVRITVDPAGRVLVWESEQSLPSDRIPDPDYPSQTRDVSGAWHRQPGCVTYWMNIDVPVPTLAEPRATVVREFDGSPVVNEVRPPK